MKDSNKKEMKITGVIDNTPVLKKHQLSFNQTLIETHFRIINTYEVKKYTSIVLSEVVNDNTKLKKDKVYLTLKKGDLVRICGNVRTVLIKDEQEIVEYIYKMKGISYCKVIKEEVK